MKARSASPHRPIPAVSALVVRGRRLLLAERGRGSAAGTFAPPGGKIEPGEHPRSALRRELAEETGLAVLAVQLTALVEVHSDGDYLLYVFLCQLASAASPTARDDAVSLRWVAREALGQMALAPGVRTLLERMRW